MPRINEHVTFVETAEQYQALPNKRSHASADLSTGNDDMREVLPDQKSQFQHLLDSMKYVIDVGKKVDNIEFILQSNAKIVRRNEKRLNSLVSSYADDDDDYTVET